jgi:CheY-like chemotaxis protein
MPELSGIEAFKEIRKFRKNILAIAQTGNAMKDEKDECMNSGFNGYISKPIDREVLLHEIFLLLNQNKYLQ